MCYTIIVGLPHSSQGEWLKKLPDDVSSWEAYQELSPVMGDSSTNVIVKGMCSCDLFSSSSYDSTIKKYHRKGWSDARIERALLDISKKRNLYGLEPSLRLWLADAADSTESVYFVAHWISNDLNVSQTIAFSSKQIRDVKTDIEEEYIVQIVGVR